MFVPIAEINIDSQLSLEEVGELISKKIFGGLKFIGREQYIRDEVPAVYLESDLLGLSYVLSGGPVDGYFLEIEPANEPADKNGVFAISEWIVSQLQSVQNIKATWEKNDLLDCNPNLPIG